MECLQNQEFDVILFDLGGVLLELAGLPIMMEWTHHTMNTREFWQKWLSSEAVRAFESGRSTPVTFAAAIVSEFSLKIDEKKFLTEFLYWPKKTFPGTESLLGQLSSAFNLGILSNTNEIHWHRLKNEMQLTEYFNFQFLSHVTGLLKPDKETFNYVIRELDCPPERILFFDDNTVNVTSARQSGMKAYRTVGIEPVLLKLRELGIISQSCSLKKT